MKTAKQLFLIPLLSLPLLAEAGSVRIYNSDSKDYQIQLKCQGRNKEMTINASRTSTYTFDSSANECKVTGGGVSFPSAIIKNGQNLTIRSGAAKPS